MTWRLTSTKRIAVLLIVAGTLIFSTHALAMFKVCLFSPVKGKVVLKGQPVVGAVLARSYDWRWKGQKGSDETTTDQNGGFSFPGIYGTMIIGSVLPHEPVIEQTINLKYQGKTHEVWYTHKREYAENAELDGKKIDLLCDLGEEPQRHEEGLLGYFGIGRLR